MIANETAKRARQFLKYFSCAFALFVVVGCATAAQLVDHAFAFDMRADDLDTVVLDYRYGESKTPMASNPEHIRAEGRSLQATHVRGEMPVGTFLYVKWRSKSSGQTYEQTVDLTKRLPRDIRGHTVYFTIRGSQLYVLLISRERTSDTPSAIVPREYRGLKTLTLFPDSLSN